LPDIRKIKDNRLEYPEPGRLTGLFSNVIDQSRDAENHERQDERIKQQHEPKGFISNILLQFYFQQPDHLCSVKSSKN
jgi:hypothetical protein